MTIPEKLRDRLNSQLEVHRIQCDLITARLEALDSLEHDLTEVIAGEPKTHAVTRAPHKTTKPKHRPATRNASAMLALSALATKRKPQPIDTVASHFREHGSNITPGGVRFVLETLVKQHSVQKVESNDGKRPRVFWRITARGRKQFNMEAPQ